MKDVLKRKIRWLESRYELFFGVAVLSAGFVPVALFTMYLKLAPWLVTGLSFLGSVVSFILYLALLTWAFKP